MKSHSATIRLFRASNLLSLKSQPRRLLSQAATASDPDTYYYSLLDSSSTSPDHLSQIHARLVVSGLHHSRFLATKLVHSCSRLGQVDRARQVFDSVPHPNVFLWNAVIKLYSQHGRFREALVMYREMASRGVAPDGFTLPCVLRACGGSQDVEAGRALHAQIFRVAYGGDVFIQNGVVAMYAKCGELERAGVVFGLLEARNVVSWTSMISGYAQNGFPFEALRMFHDMRSCEDIRPDFITLVSVLKAYTDVQDLEQGKSAHGYVIKSGMELELDLRITLTAMYAKCGQVLAAKTLFEHVPSPSVILWNAMISGYAKQGYFNETVQLFKKMASGGIKPDSITLRSVILACSQIGSLEMAKWMEEYISSSEYSDDMFVNTALIDMYSKCGNVDSAYQMFERIPCKDTVAWSAIIVGYGLNSRVHEAIDMFNRMKLAGVEPNDVTFLGLLLACCHAGLVGEGWHYFYSMMDHGIEPRHQHYACMVDILARAGLLVDAYEFILKMPLEPTISIWGALLSACKVHGNVEIGSHAANHVFSLDPSNAGHYVQLSNLYASAGMWDDVAKVRMLMKEKGVTKPIGSSLIEINGKLQAFRVSEKSYAKSREVLVALEELEHKLKGAGLDPYKNFVAYDAGSEREDESMCNHDERLAIAFGLISTPHGSTLRIIKNLRACVNCHSATKLISKIVGREIIVRDANRFHHFKDGCCSCRDLW